MGLFINTGAVSTADQNFSGQKTVDTNATNNNAVIGGRVYSAVAASTAVSNTVAETLFDANYIIPGKSLRVGSVIRIWFQGIATATNGTDTLAIKLYIGGLTGTALIALAARDVANNDIFFGVAEVTIRTIGTSGTFVASSLAPVSPNAAGTAATMNFVASTAIDTTVDQKIGVSATWSVASASDSCRLDQLDIDVI